MPIKVPTGLPAFDAIKAEGVSVTELNTVTDNTQRIALLNLMPMKETTEKDFIRILASSSEEIELTLMKLDTHTPKHTAPEHMQRYYKGFNELRSSRFDGLIITGAPIEKIEFEDVTYWQELCDIFEWAKSNVTSTLFICWAAQAGLYQKFGIQKHLLPNKMFGIFPHYILRRDYPLFEGFKAEFFVPHSRHTNVYRNDVLAENRIELLSESDSSGVYIMQEKGTRNFFVTGHSEYPLYTLDEEYKRDVSKGLPIELPLNYYTNNNPQLPPVGRWQNEARKLFCNWIRYYVKK